MKPLNLEEERLINEKVERSVRLAQEACYRPPEPILLYESIDQVFDAHPDWKEAQRYLAERREELILYLQNQKPLEGPPKQNQIDFFR